MKAIWNDKVVAESDRTIEIEGNQYFPPESIKKEYFEKTDHNTVCPWKGEASYYTLKVDGKENKNAVWSYHEPKEEARALEDYLAFWNGVEVKE